MQEILKKIRQYEIKIRKEVTSRVSGDYRSVFKGSGLEFDDVRSYQYGDDVRTIDWNVSAKGHGTFVKTFKEEKEQNVFFILDVSSSQEIGSARKAKLEIGKEICAILALSAGRESSTVGLIGYSNIKEIFIRPDKGLPHIYHIIYKLFALQTKSAQTDLNACLQYSSSILKKRSIVILISDFIDEGYEKKLTAIASKHDLVVIHLSDPIEFNFPRLGIIPVVDKETRKTKWVNTSSKKFRATFSKSFNDRKTALKNLCISNNAAYLWLNTHEDYAPQLANLFKRRKKS